MNKNKTSKLKAKEIAKITGIPVLVASLCCTAPLLLFIFGLGSATLAASWADIFYYQYKWAFRGVGLTLLAVSLFLYFYKYRGICTLDQAKRRRNEIINVALIALFVFVLAYMLWLYGIIHIIGAWLGVWEWVPENFQWKDLL